MSTAVPAPAPKPAKPLSAFEKKTLNKLVDDYEPKVRWLVNDITSRMQAALPGVRSGIDALLDSGFKKVDDALETKDDDAVTALFTQVRASLK